MKKNAMLKIAAILMVAVLLTTCAISSTFAKYVTDYTGVTSNQARVAKWGIEIISSGNGEIGLFANAYEDEVQGASNAVVVAPGTESTQAFSVKVTGTPEVDYKLNVKADLDLTDESGNSKWADKDGVYYCPLVITVDGTPIAGMSYPSYDKFEEAVEKEIVKAILGEVVNPDGEGVYSKSYNALEPVPTTASDADGVAVSWAWAFTGAEGQDNVKDTYLGNQANAYIKISYSVGAEQIGD